MQNSRVIYTAPEGSLCVIVPAPGVSQADVLNAVPAGIPYEVVDASMVPADRTFRNAWKKGAVNKVDIDLPKAKLITHDRRRAKRAAEFAPLDIEATIPAKAPVAEAARQVIRDKYTAMQTSIDACTTAEALKTIIDLNGL